MGGSKLDPIVITLHVLQLPHARPILSVQLSAIHDNFEESLILEMLAALSVGGLVKNEEGLLIVFWGFGKHTHTDLPLVPNELKLGK